MSTHDETTPADEESTGREGAVPASSVHRPPPGAHFMNLLRWTLFVFLLVLAVVSIGSYVASRRPAPAAKQAESKVVWRCPMHPAYTSDKPGDCPICGMSLERVVLGDEQAERTSARQT